jgi:flagellar hook-associated protein 1 FlgK
VQVSSTENADGSINVLMGAQVLVNGTTSKTDLFTVPNPGNNGFFDITYGSGGPSATVGNAGIGGRLTSRDTTVPKYQAQLDTIASNLATAMNTLHTAGFDVNGNPGQAFFTSNNPPQPISALTITVNPNIQTDPGLIAAAGLKDPLDPLSGSAGPGNNEVALSIIKLRTSMSPPLAAGTPTSETAYNSMVSGLGMENRTTRNEAETQQSLVDLLQRRRESLSGVSLDEESVNLLRYQRAYEASARVLSAYDELLDKLINNTGIVGR